MTPTSPRIVVTVGTDHHRFDRLVAWIEDLVPDVIHGAEVLVQHGASRASPLLKNNDFLPRPELLRLMSEADVVVGHGGPGTIMDARSMGRLPVVVPRRAHLGEVVDDHQLAFCRRLAQQRLIVSVEDARSLRRAIQDGLDDPSRLRVRDADRSDQNAQVIEYLRGVEDGLTRPSRSVLLARLRGLVRGARS